MACMLIIPSDNAAHLDVDIKKIMGDEFEYIVGGKKGDDSTVYVIIEHTPPSPNEQQLSVLADRRKGKYKRI